MRYLAVGAGQKRGARTYVGRERRPSVAGKVPIVVRGGDACTCILYRRATQLVPRESPIGSMHRPETAEQSGSRNAEGATNRYAAVEAFGCGRIRRPTGSVIAPQCRVVGGVYLIETVAAEPGRVGLDYAKCKRDRHRSIDCVATHA